MTPYTTTRKIRPRLLANSTVTGAVAKPALSSTVTRPGSETPVDDDPCLGISEAGLGMMTGRTAAGGKLLCATAWFERIGNPASQ